jgi:hypothetical protein
MPMKRDAQPMSEFFKFRTVGQVVVGQIDKFGTSGVYDTQFMVLAPAIIRADPNAQPKKFGSVAVGLSADLLSKINPRKDLGVYISVEFTGTEPSRKGKPKRIFSVSEYSNLEFNKLENRATEEFAGNAYQRDRDDDAPPADDDDDLPF